MTEMSDLCYLRKTRLGRFDRTFALANGNGHKLNLIRALLFTSYFSTIEVAWLIDSFALISLLQFPSFDLLLI